MTDVTTLDQRRIETLRQIMKALRTPETGCPWDIEQSFQSIAPYTLEEAYEVADAIERHDMPGLKEELGDLLLQVVYHSQIANEHDLFTLDDVIEAINRKMIRRHPHVFGDEAARNAKLAKSFWEDAKAREKTDAPQASVLDGVPNTLPALTRALKLQAKAARVGFDWPSRQEVLAKIAEEAKELEEASPATQAEEYGDLLFVLVNAGRHLGLDPETALRMANTKFTRRFNYIEEQLAKRGSSPAQSSLEEMDGLWNEAKVVERKRPDAG